MKRLMLIVILLIYSAADAWSFQDPMKLTMQDAVQYALEHNPSVRAAEARVSAASAYRLQAWALPQPEVMIHYEGMPDGTYFETWGSRKIFFTQRFSFPTNYIVDYQRRGSLLKGAGYSLDLEKLRLIAQVKTAYIEALLDRERLTLAQENLDLSDGLLEKAELRFNLGEENRKDYLWAKLQKDRAQNAVHAARIEYNEAQETLAQLLSGSTGDTQGAGFELVDELAFYPVDISGFGAAGSMLDRHARVNLSESAVRAASKSLSLAKSSFLPDIMVAYMKENNNNIPGFWGFRVAMSVPLWFWSDQRGKISEARAALNAAGWERTGERQAAAAEYNKVLFSLRESEQQARSFTEEILGQAEQVYRLAEVSYREGESDYVDLLLAQQLLVETRKEYFEAIAGYNKAVAQFELAAGRSLQQ